MSKLPSKIDKNKALELANLIQIAYYKNKKYLEHSIEGKDEIPNLFEPVLSCNSDPNFNEEVDEHDQHNNYKVIKWLFHTDRPVGFLKPKPLRTVPFGYIAENKEEKELFIVLRGTITSEEWRNNFTASLSEKYQGSAKLGLVHAGFSSIFTSSYSDRISSKSGFYTRQLRRLRLYQDPKPEFRASIAEDLNKFVVNSGWHRRGYKIFITGHSLGGALALLAGQHLLSQDYEAYQSILSICTFAAPRTGNIGFSEWFSLVDVVRYVNSEDIVPTVPPSTRNLLGEDMNEFNDGKIKAERERGFVNIDELYAIRKGGVKANELEPLATEAIKAFVQIGTTRTFTDNRGSVSFNHNLKTTYRKGVVKIG